LRQYALIWIEAAILLFVLLATRWIWRGSRRKGINSLLDVAGHNPARLVILTGVIALVAHLAVWTSVGTPQPAVHDEFSFLFMADTFSSGKLANPVHPLWIFFETFHISQGPTYSSVYPPGQGLMLLLGQTLGHPAIGVWIITALMCAAVCWMLQAWVPLPWAFVGGLIAIMRIGLFSYWANSYWGGSLAALGGCLVWGAVGRLRSKLDTGSALIFALGLMILANTRPYEGLWCALPAVACLGFSFARAARSPMLLRAAAPILIALTVGAAAMLYYNWRVFGDALEMPYQANRARYSRVGSFLWESLQPEPLYNHAVMRDFYTKFETKGFASNRTLLEYMVVSGIKALVFWTFYISAALTLPFLAGLIRIRRYRKVMWPAVGAASTVLALSLLVWTTNAHYSAPATGCFYVLIILGLRLLYVSRRRAAVPGKWIAVSILFTCLAMLPLRVVAERLGVPNVNGAYPIPWYSGSLYSLDLRTRLIQQLERQGGKHVVIVRYTPDHDYHFEYVFNRADIDASPIVWARELETPEQSRPLLDYYQGRSIWLLRPDESETLVPYPIR